MNKVYQVLALTLSLNECVISFNPQSNEPANTQDADSGFSAGKKLSVLWLEKWQVIGFPPTVSQPQANHEAEINPYPSKFFAKISAALQEEWLETDKLSYREITIRLASYESATTRCLALGGYGNIVIAESFRRLAVTVIGRFIVHNSKLIDETEKLLVIPKASIWGSASVQRLLGQEANLLNKPNFEFRDSLGVFRLWGRESGTIMHDVIATPPTSSMLLINRRVDLLMFRILESDRLRALSIPGYLHFLRQGGTQAEILSDDVRPFNALVGDVRYTMQYLALGDTTLNAGHIWGLTETFKANAELNPFFIRQAWE